MELWMQLINSETDSGTFDFIHHSTSSTVQLMKFNSEGEKESEIRMDYFEFGELCDFIKKLTEHI